MYPVLLNSVRSAESVTMHPVRTISREVAHRKLSSDVLTLQRLNAEPLEETFESSQE